MAKQDTTEHDGPETELVWAQSPATGRKKQMTRSKLRALGLAGWKQTSEPKADDPLVVSPFPTVAPGDDGADSPADQAGQNTRTGRAAAAQKEGN